MSNIIRTALYVILVIIVINFILAAIQVALWLGYAVIKMIVRKISKKQKIVIIGL